MRRIASFLLGLVALAAQPVLAQTVGQAYAQPVVVYQEVIEEEIVVPDTGSERFVQTPARSADFVHAEPADIPRGIARFGPFRVLDGQRAALVDVTDERSAVQFAAMLKAYPGLRTLEMIECPGTEDDRANLRIGRMIRAQGMTTHVPRGGSVRSGAVELFLAGAKRVADAGSEFAVHSWSDNLGLEPDDYAADAPENRVYVTYYREMGMTEQEARAFYAMTNSVPQADALWLSSADMGRWVRLDTLRPVAPLVAELTLDSGAALN